MNTRTQFDYNSYNNTIYKRIFFFELDFYVIKKYSY